MSKSKFVQHPQEGFIQKLELKEPFIRLYHEKEVTALNISRLLTFNAGYPKCNLGNGELNDIYQSVRQSTFLKHFSYHSNEQAWKNMEQTREPIKATYDSYTRLSALIAEEAKTKDNYSNPQQVRDAATKKISELASSQQHQQALIYQSYLPKYSLLYQHQILIKSIVRNKYLTDINLEKMFMGDDLAIIFSQIFMFNKAIQKLNIAYNNIGNEGGVAIAEKMDSYKAITHLNLSNNHITLEALKAFGKSLSSNGNLIDLNLANNIDTAATKPTSSIAVGGDDSIGMIIAGNESLTSLDISHIPLSSITEIADTATETSSAQDIPGDTTGRPSEIAENTVVESLPSARILGNAALKALHNNKSLVYLNTSYCLNDAFQRDGAASIAELLANNSTITELDISFNSISVEGLKHIAESLKCNKTIKTINISHNIGGVVDELGINEEGEAAGEVIAIILTDNHSITKLNISHNNLGYGGTKPIAEALKDNTVLIDINIAYNNLGKAGAIYLGKALEQNNTLTSLDLSGNKILSAGLMFIAQALVRNPTLKHLSLAANQILSPDTGGIEALLSTIGTLVTLDLSNNSLSSTGNNGLAFLSAALIQNLSLVNLFLDNNPLTAPGVKSIVAALKNHHSLVKLGLSTTQMGDQGAKEMLDGLKDNLSIAIIDISHNNITAIGAVHISSLIGHNACITRIEINQHANLNRTSQDDFERPINLSSSIIELSGTPNSLSGLFTSILKNHDLLQSNLRKLETDEGQDFTTKQLLILWKQLQGKTSDTPSAELSYSDMKSDEFYIKKIAEIFNAKYYSPAQKAKTLELSEKEEAITSATESPADGGAAVPEVVTTDNIISTAVAHDIYFDALVNGGLLGFLDVHVDVMQ